MPTYEYHCQKCGHTFETAQSIKDPPLATCPKDVCPKPRWGKGQVKRAVGGGSGLLFKGSGFYITDYRSEGYKQAASKEASGAASEPKKPSPAPEKTPKPTPVKPAA